MKNKPYPTKELKEDFLQLLEDDEQLFKETLEVMLTLVISDPKLTFAVADLIESDFQNLFLIFMKKAAAKRNSDITLGCCKDL